MVKVGIIGATGYTGAELVRLLGRHPQVELVALTTQQYVGLPFTEVYPHLSGKVNLVGEELNIPALVAKCEAIFVSLPHGHALPVAQEVIRQGKKMIDLGADLRLKDPAAYAKWYQVDLNQSLGRTIVAQLLAQAVYGLPELHRQEIKQAKVVANPGCYPTSALLGLAPLLKNKIIGQNRIIIDAKSGVSGAGRGLSLNTHYGEVNENIKAYCVANHRHTPEIEQEVSLLAGGEIKVTFTPHLTPMTRGILSTIYAPLTVNASPQEILNLYRTFYQGEHFIRIMPSHILPGTKMVAGSNYCALGIVVDERTNQVIILSAIDNLIKGASGQAVQNMNIMFGLPETTALEEAGVYP
jgi:N-acetyl-gamma-glutamyl-phosphate reductase